MTLGNNTQTGLIDHIEQSTNPSPEATVIWLHGLGADGADFVPIIPELHLPPNLPVRFIFPHAPVMPVSINGGYAMRAWYDIYSAAIETKIDEAGMANSVALINQFITAEERRGIPTECIFLAGFSQGAVIALIAGLSHKKPLGGVIALSGYLPLAEKVLSTASTKLPVFIGQGTDDTIVPPALSQSAYTALKKAGYEVSFHLYPMAHSVCGEEIGDISRWLQECAK